jgi:hypothetical protein
MIAFRAPSKTSAAYLAAHYIYKHGPVTASVLFNHVQFTEKFRNREASLERALGGGFLTELEGFIVLTEFAREHFDAIEPPKEKYVGEIVQPRTVDVMGRPPLSKKNIPNWRDGRDDIPAWSVRGK